VEKTIKLLSFIFLFLSQTLILTDYSFIDFAINNQAATCNDCPDICNHFESAHSHGSDDNILPGELKSTQPLPKIGLITIKDIKFENSFTTTIWQPPKIS